MKVNLEKNASKVNEDSLENYTILVMKNFKEQSSTN